MAATQISSFITNSSKQRQILLGIGAIGAFVLIMALIKGTQIWIAISNPFVPPPEAVTLAVVKKEIWPKVLGATASIRPAQGVHLRAEEPGRVIKIGFESGQPVEKGALLVEFDTSVEDAELQGALAAIERTQKAWDRAQSLRREKTVSQEFYDQAQNDFRQAEAQVASLRSRIARKKVTAPFSGRAGIRQINVGDVVEVGAPLVPLYATDPLFLDFTIPQRFAGEVRVGQKVTFHVDAYPGVDFEASLSAINPQIDEATRTLAVQATARNEDAKLLPGMFAQSELSLSESDSYLTLPISAVSFAPYGNSVYVAEPMKNPQSGEEYRGVRQQIVQLGPRRGDQIAVLTGLTEGQEVASSGVFKLRPGVAITVDNAFAPSDAAKPTPSDS